MNPLKSIQRSKRTIPGCSGDSLLQKLFVGNTPDSLSFSFAARDLQTNNQQARNQRHQFYHYPFLKIGKEAPKQLAFDPESYFFIDHINDPKIGKSTQVKRP